MPGKPPTLNAPRRYGWGNGSDRRWRKLRARKLAEEPRCEPCLAKGLVTVATEVHHVLPISQGGGKYDWNNLESVCGECQDEAHGARSKIKIDARTGLPLPGQNHPWSEQMTGGGGASRKISIASGGHHPLLSHVHWQLGISRLTPG